MRKSLYSLFLMSFMISMLCATPALAQERKGTINGRVTDADHRALQGARVELQPTGLTAVTDGQGQFTISDVAPGAYTLTVSYVGFSPFSAPVTVTPGSPAQVDALLQVGSVSGAVVIRAERQRGEEEALNRERTADNILQVLPAEVIMSLPNTNIADALGRLPSVSLERDEGEGKYVQIRGTEPRLSNLTINGVHVSSPEGNVRNVKLDVIPADLVESIEVSKTLSANQDGDAIGGSINLVTKSAGDEPFYSVSGLYGYTPIANGRSLTQIDATMGRRFGPEKKLGVFVGGTYDYNGRGINDIEPSPGTLPANYFNDGRGPIPVFFGTDLREYEYYRNRYGFAGNLDYRLKNGSSAYLRGLFSDFRDFGDTWVYSPGPGTFLTPTTADNSGSMGYRHYIRRPEQQIFSITAGEKLNMGRYVLAYQFAASRSRQNGGFSFANFDGPSNVAFGLDTSNPFVPRFPVLNGVNVYDPTLFSLNNVVIPNDHTREIDIEGSVSLARSYTWGPRNGSFEVGGKVRNGNKNQTVDDKTYRHTAGPTPLLSQVLGGYTDPNYYFNQYTMGPLSDFNKILGFLSSNPGAFTLDASTSHQRSDPNNYKTTERVYAAYAMNTLSFGRARLQTGVRVETTQSNFTGFHVATDGTGNYLSTTPVTGNSTYTNVLPSVQFQYAITPSTNLRAAYGIGIARPNFSDLPPFISENGSNHQVNVGNPALKPTRANNFDFLVEKYLTPFGLLQAGIFYKDFSDPIYNVKTKITTGTFAGFTQSQPVNGQKAHIFGLETSVQERLRFMPGRLSGLGVSANYSYTTSRAIVPNRGPNPTIPFRSDNPPLLRQGPNNWNVDVTYDKGRISSRFGTTHNDAYIYSYNYSDGDDGGLRGPNGDVYVYAHTQMDAQASVRVKRGLQMIVSLLNLNNEVFGFYQGSPQYPIQREFYNRTFMFGLRWSSAKER
jgi:TonB-dependent receptor